MRADRPALIPRESLIARLAKPERYDLAIVGGGATGLGLALDAVLRGFSVVLIEAQDFAKGTSSRTTKLVHGGVRYLARGNFGLVYEALHERANLLRNAPHIAQPLPFVVPTYKFWEGPFYGLGLKAYDLLAGSSGLGPTKFFNRSETLHALPNAQPNGLRGGIEYWDAQFDDARLAITLARTAHAKGALLVNYCPAVGLLHEGAHVAGLVCEDRETGARYQVRARCVVNATGVWVDQLRKFDDDAGERATSPMVQPSQGVHLVVDRDFLPGKHALMVPSTADGRVLFAVPWLGKVILGTTDTPRSDLPLDPVPQRQEIDFILREAARYLHRAPTRADIRSQWAGLRPLVKPVGDESGDKSTKALSREHTIVSSASGLITVTGGKWTTYRAMAEDVMERIFELGKLESAPAGATLSQPLLGAGNPNASQPGVVAAPGLHSYGDEADWVGALPGAEVNLGSGLTEAMVRFAIRHEFARTVEDVLARRSRLLMLDAARAVELAPAVAKILSEECRFNVQPEPFYAVAGIYGGAKANAA